MRARASRDQRETADYFFEQAPDRARVYGLFFNQLSAVCPFWGWKDPVEYWRLVERTGGGAEDRWRPSVGALAVARRARLLRCAGALHPCLRQGLRRGFLTQRRA